MPKRNIKFIFIVSIIFFVIVYYVSIRQYSIYGNRIAALSTRGETIYAEIVSTDEKRASGLSKRSGVCSSCGMLFEFQAAGKYAFWMKDMKFPIDIIWIDNGAVVHIEKNIQPAFKGVLNPGVGANSVLEVTAGKAENLGIEVGDEIDF